MSKINKVPFQHVQDMVDSLEFVFARVGDTTTTGCWAFLPNNFKVGYGESSCVDPNEYNKELGETFAKERALADATNNIWQLEGYLLKVTGKLSSDFPEKSFAQIHKDYYNLK